MAHKPITQELFELYLANIWETEDPTQSQSFASIQENFEAGRGNLNQLTVNSYQLSNFNW